jgi:hypothetical protein
MEGMKKVWKVRRWCGRYEDGMEGMKQEWKV